MMDYIKVYENVLPDDICKHIIQKFELLKQQQEDTILEDHRSFKEINLNKHDDWKNEIGLLVSVFQKYLGKYREDNNIDINVWPDSYGLEQIRMKRYVPNGIDEFRFHADVMDHESAKRFLVAFFYLNDVEEGGETGFKYNRNQESLLKVKPETGKLLMFPPFWTHPHIGYPPISGTKYIIGTYLHYL